jgi:hypothetical protein
MHSSVLIISIPSDDFSIVCSSSKEDSIWSLELNNHHTHKTYTIKTEFGILLSEKNKNPLLFVDIGFHSLIDPVTQHTYSTNSHSFSDICIDCNISNAQSRAFVTITPQEPIQQLLGVAGCIPVLCIDQL